MCGDVFGELKMCGHGFGELKMCRDGFGELNMYGEQIKTIQEWKYALCHMGVSIFLFVFARFQTFCSLLVFYSTFWWFSGEDDQIRAKTSKKQQKGAKMSKNQQLLVFASFCSFLLVFARFGSFLLVVGVRCSCLLVFGGGWGGDFEDQIIAKMSKQKQE